MLSLFNVGCVLTKASKGGSLRGWTLKFHRSVQPTNLKSSKDGSGGDGVEPDASCRSAASTKPYSAESLPTADRRAALPN